jgi:prevent-host-death family protein
MHQVSLEIASTQLQELIQEARQGEEVVLTQDNWPVAKIVSLSLPRRRRQPGSAKEIILHIADDFDATPEGFEEYMP